MAENSSDLSRRAFFRGALGVSALGAGVVLAGCATVEKLQLNTDFRTTGPYGVSELQTIAYGSDADVQYGMFAVPVHGDGEPVSDTVPVVVMIHGGSWEDASDMSYMTDIGTDLVSHGVAVWSIAYRGTIHAGQSERGPARAGWPAAGYDVAAGVDFVPRLSEHTPVHLDERRIVLLGHSAGGHLATWAASRGRLESGRVGADPAVEPVGCVSMAGIYDLESAFRQDSNDRVEALIGGTPDEKPDAYREASPQDLVPIGVPVIACRGGQDELIPAHQAEDYVSKARDEGDPAELAVIQGADHNAWTVLEHEAWALARGHTLRLAGL